jgi:hypothetical protein
VNEETNRQPGQKPKDASSGPSPQPTGEDTNVQLYWAIFETWCAQVDSYWTRTSYFAAFETAAIAGTWVLLNSRDDYKLGHLFLIFGILLTPLWIYSNVKTHRYHLYWWETLKEIERRSGWKQRPDYVSNYEDRRKGFKQVWRQDGLLVTPSKRLDDWIDERSYSYFTDKIVPLLFLIVWICLIFAYWILRPGPPVSWGMGLWKTNFIGT